MLIHRGLHSLAPVPSRERYEPPVSPTARECGRASDRFLLLVVGLAFALLLFFLVLLVGAEHDLAVERQSLEQKVEPLTVFVWERHTEVQPVVVLVVALDDGVRAVSRFRHGGVLLYRVGTTTLHMG